jgi:hypothetical protein
MKTRNLQVSLLSAAVITLLTFAVPDAPAQDSIAVAPALSHGVPQILQLSQANVGDDVIVRYIQNSGTIFALSAPEIVYLKEQGMSDLVLNTMLDQRHRLTGSTEPATTPENQAAGQTPVTIVQPVTCVATTSASMVYVMPDTQTDRYDRWYSGHPYGYRYGNGFYEWPYSYSSVSVIIVGDHRAGYHHIRDHIVSRY